LLATFLGVDQMTAGWTRRRPLGLLVVAAVGFLGVGGPAGSDLGNWAMAGLVTATALLAVYVTLLRFDLTMTPLALGVAAALTTLAGGFQQPFPGALAGTLIGTPAVMLVAWWLFLTLRRARHASS
jgi:preprotein translocase subunit SecF